MKFKTTDKGAYAMAVKRATFLATINDRVHVICVMKNDPEYYSVHPVTAPEAKQALPGTIITHVYSDGSTECWDQ